MIEGTLVAESIRVGAALDGVRLVTRKIRRAAQGDGSAGQPELWTLIEFEAEESDAEVLADALARVLDQQHGWYADFRTPDETFVVYSGRVFRYPRGDSPGRAEAAAYGRSMGVPEDQLDWPVLGSSVLSAISSARCAVAAFGRFLRGTLHSLAVSGPPCLVT